MLNYKMKNKLSILYITPPNDKIVTPEVGFARDLSKLGHNVCLLKSCNDYPNSVLTEKFDIIMGAMEYSMGLANYLGKRLNIPVYNHMEWIPPWRINLSVLDKWGQEESSLEKVTPEMIDIYKNLYKKQAEDWAKATIRSCAGKCFVEGINEFLDTPVDCEIKYYAPNIDKLQQYYNPNLKEHYQIMSTARLVPHKKIVHVVRALAKIPKEKRPNYIIIGYGKEAEQIINESKKLNVNIALVGPGDNGLKEQIIQESMFSVNIWAGIPIAESFYFKKPAISYADTHMLEVFGNDVVDFVKSDDIDALAKKIEFLCDNPEYRKLRGEQGYQAMMNDKIGMGTPQKLVKQIEAILYKGVELWKEQHK